MGKEENKNSIRPDDYTDLGQANVLVRKYGDKLLFNSSTGPLVYNGAKWEESELKARRLAQDLTAEQLKKASAELKFAQEQLATAQIAEDPASIQEAKKFLADAKRFWDHVLTSRRSSRISAALTEAYPQVEIGIDELDADGFLLNTPIGTLDLQTGTVQPHRPEDYITKITAVAPDPIGADTWASFIDDITGGDKELARFLKIVSGSQIIGRVLDERFYIDFGEGGNGKSTFEGVKMRVLGDYAGSISADVITLNDKRNKSPEIAEIRGRRFVVMGELEDGSVMAVGAAKKLTSRDRIVAERKYRDPQSFRPTHHLVLFTNVLPRIGGNDRGTWDRVVVVPFNTRIRGTDKDIKDYDSYLFEHCGGACLTWMIEGAMEFIASDYKIEEPEAVKAAIAAYRGQCDWLGQFIADCCEEDKGFKEASGSLYSRYRGWAERQGEYIRRSDAFSQALSNAGFKSHRDKRGVIIYGLRLRDNLASISDRSLGSNVSNS